MQEPEFSQDNPEGSWGVCRALFPPLEATVRLHSCSCCDWSGREPTTEVLEKGPRKRRSHQKDRSAFPQWPCGCEQRFPKCSPWTKIMSTPWDPSSPGWIDRNSGPQPSSPDDHRLRGRVSWQVTGLFGPETLQCPLSIKPLFSLRFESEPTTHLLHNARTLGITKPKE